MCKQPVEALHHVSIRNNLATPMGHHIQSSREGLYLLEKEKSQLPKFEATFINLKLRGKKIHQVQVVTEGLSQPLIFQAQSSGKAPQMHPSLTYFQGLPRLTVHCFQKFLLMYVKSNPEKYRWRKKAKQAVAAREKASGKFLIFFPSSVLFQPRLSRETAIRVGG